MSELRVPFAAAESEFTEKKSRFISHIWNVKTEEEAQQHIKEMKAKYHDARHNCFCYVIDANTVRYSDDGEPQGTAGQPMLKVFERENVQNYCCVVTRYFGGILLGAGGLTRAYAKAAKDALIASGVAQMQDFMLYEVRCTYALLDRIKTDSERMGVKLEIKNYGEEITIEAKVSVSDSDLFQTRLRDLSSDSAKVQLISVIKEPGEKIEVQ